MKTIIKNYDIICDGTDNYETRYLINDQCKKDKKILISAVISKFDGHLYMFNFNKKLLATDALCLKNLMYLMIANLRGSFLR